MAADEKEPLFEKLRVDTTTPKPVASPFHFITERKQEDVDESAKDAASSIAQESLLTSSIATSSAFDPACGTTAIPKTALLASDTLVQQHKDRHAPKLADADAAIFADCSSHVLSINAPTRRRGASVSFDPFKTFDDGHCLSLEETLPKPSDTLAIPRDARIDNPPIRSHSESERVRVNPFTGEVRSRRKPRRTVRIEENNQPFLDEATENGLQGVGYDIYDESASLGSKLSELIVTDRTNLAFGDVENFAESPLPVSSPISLSYQGESTTAWPASQPLSARPVFHRANTLSSSGSLRRANRRASARSAPSTTSPAGAFLSQWAREEAISTAQPDDEGQEIGDHSEYIIGRQIGYGGFSVVKEAFTIEDGVKIRKAVKIVRKHVSGATEHENEKLQAEFEHEVSIWRFFEASICSSSACCL